MLKLLALFFTKFLIAENQTTTMTSAVTIQTASKNEYFLVPIKGQVVVDQSVSKIKWHEDINIVSSSQFNSAQEKLCYEIRLVFIAKFPDIGCELISTIPGDGSMMTMEYKIHMPYKIGIGAKEEFDEVITSSAKSLDSVGLSMGSSEEGYYVKFKIGSCIVGGDKEICGPSSAAEMRYFFVIVAWVWMF